MRLNSGKLKELAYHLSREFRWPLVSWYHDSGDLVLSAHGRKTRISPDDFFDYGEAAKFIKDWVESSDAIIKAAAVSRTKCHKSASLRLRKDLKPRGSRRPTLARYNKLRRITWVFADGNRLSFMGGEPPERMVGFPNPQMWPARPGFGADPAPNNSPYHYHETQGPFGPVVFYCPNCGSPVDTFSVLCDTCELNST